MGSELLNGFYLNGLLVDPAKGEISGPDGSVHLSPKAIEVLLVLASHPRTLVTQESLLAEAWRENSGSPDALEHAISELRQALDDSADQAHFIEAIPQRGYRLIVDVTPAKDLTESVVIGRDGTQQIERLGFFDNLRRRGVVETAVAYAILGWLIIQIADIVFGQLLLPPWIGTFVTILVIAGFPIALILSWFLELRNGDAVLHELSPRDAVRHRFTRTYVSIVGALAISAVGVYIYDRNIGLPEAGQVSADAAVDLPPVAENTIAVLPFFNLDGSAETEIFSNGLADDLINRLARVPGLLVASRGDAFTLEPNSASARVRERLRVAMYLEGSVQIVADQMRIIVQLIDSSNGFHVFSQNYDRAVADYFQTRNEITELAVSHIRLALPENVQSVSVPANSEMDLNAYVLFRRGREAFERTRTEKSLQESIDFFEQALAIDGRYAAAYAGLCDAYIQNYRLTSDSEDIDRAEEACADALTLNPRLNLVHTSLGDLYRSTGRMVDAEAAYGRALLIVPNDTRAMAGLAIIYRRQQKLEEAEEILNTAIASQPGNWRTIRSLGDFLFYVGRFAEAADTYRQVIAIEPQNSEVRSNLGSALTMAGDFDAGRTVYEEALAIEPTQRTYSNLGVIYYYLGDFEQSVRMHRNAVEMSPGIALMWTNLGDALHFADQPAQSIAAYREAIEITERRLQTNPMDTESAFLLAWSKQMTGDNEAALDIVTRTLADAADDPYSYYYDALIRLQNGDDSGAITALETALELGYPANMLVAEPLLGDLRDEPGFRELL